MNGTTDRADLISRKLFVAEQRAREVELELKRVILNNYELQRVSNIGVYFLFCLFGLAILALFLCRSMQALQASLFFFVLRSQVWQVFMYQ